MPFFRVMLSGTGISIPLEDASDPVIGFFTTRDVFAQNADQAEAKAVELVLKHWTPGGSYAAANQGAIPTLTLDKLWRVSYLYGLFGRKPSGYSFYSHE